MRGEEGRRQGRDSAEPIGDGSLQRGRGAHGGQAGQGERGECRGEERRSKGAIDRKARSGGMEEREGREGRCDRAVSPGWERAVRGEEPLAAQRTSEQAKRGRRTVKRGKTYMWDMVSPLSRREIHGPSKQRLVLPAANLSPAQFTDQQFDVTDLEFRWASDIWRTFYLATSTGYGRIRGPGFHSFQSFLLAVGPSRSEALCIAVFGVSVHLRLGATPIHRV